jgi:CRISPR system Cascade subunit CasE
LDFKLRVNPIRKDKKERTETETEAWQSNRQGRGFKEKEPTKKRIRHDVVMDAKKRIGFKDLPYDRRTFVAALIQEAGMTWLKEKGKEFGFFVEDNKEKPQVRVDGYLQHKLYKRKATKPVFLSTLDFSGTLTVIDPEIFVTRCLFGGIGPAKAFGCGLMLVKRI